MTSLGLHWISSADPPNAFPDIDNALVEPDGLLAAGGDLSEERLIFAYRHGIFPWYENGQPILWWSPDPRCVILPPEIHVSRRLRRTFRTGDFQVSFNTQFDSVIEACAGPRKGHRGTWITSDMDNAYRRLHASGWAHSVEVWRRDALIGGLYGLAIGRAFFGESMYSHAPHASKAAMLVLCRLLEEEGFSLLDCQVASSHLLTLGARLIARSRFRAMLDAACSDATRFDAWPGEPIRLAEIL